MNVYIILESYKGAGDYNYDMIRGVYDCPNMAKEVLEKLKKDNKASVLGYYMREWKVTQRNIV